MKETKIKMSSSSSINGHPDPYDILQLRVCISIS